MIFKTNINVDYKGVHYRTGIEHIVDTTREELEAFEKEITKGNPYISKVFEIKEEVKEVKTKVKEKPVKKKKK